MPILAGPDTLAYLGVPALGEGVNGRSLPHQTTPASIGGGQVGAGLGNEVGVGGEARGIGRPVNHSKDGFILLDGREKNKK